MKYLLRLDDACPTMNAANWARIEDILNKYALKPMVGVIPDNRDSMQELSPADNNFWERVKSWENKGWTIALHGYDHCYISSDAGINPLWNRSEFAGLPLDEQKEKIQKGIEIFHSHQLNPKYFFAPSHTFDLNTLKALEECSDIRIISDTIATKPYKRHGFIFIPQMGGRCREMKYNGIWTFCLHPSLMEDNAFTKLEKFISKNASRFTSFDDIDYALIKRDKSFDGKVLSFLFFTRRKISQFLSRYNTKN